MLKKLGEIVRRSSFSSHYHKAPVLMTLIKMLKELKVEIFKFWPNFDQNLHYNIIITFDISLSAITIEEILTKDRYIWVKSYDMYIFGMGQITFPCLE